MFLSNGIYKNGYLRSIVVGEDFVYCIVNYFYFFFKEFFVIED